MLRKLISAAMIALAWLIASPLHATPRNKRGSFDRLAVVQAFLDAAYPDLKQVHGLLFSHSLEFHLSAPNGLTGQYIDVIPCYPGSGVPGDGETPPSLPRCAGLFLPSSSAFLTMGLGYSDKLPISVFEARGSFVEAKSQATKQEIASHPEWTKKEWTEAAARANPRFGPDQKEDFVRSIPVQAIAEFTGCRLDTATASFLVDREAVASDPLRVEIQWTVSGKRKNPRGFGNRCRATFEPFEGKLLSVDFRLQ